MADMEDVKHFLKLGLLSDEFKAKLKEAYDEKALWYGDTLVINYPTEVFTHPKWDPAQMFPYGELNGTISRNTQPDSDVIALSHEVQVFWHVRHDDEEELDKHINRFMHATRRYFRDHPYLDALGNAPITTNDDLYSPFVPANIYNAAPFVKSGMVTIYVGTYD